MSPKKIALLTDSCADLDAAAAREQNIFVVPLRILCRDGEYLDGVDIDGEAVCRRLREGELPQTSLPRLEDVASAVTEIVGLGYDAVLGVMLSGGLSGTYNLARIVAEECR
ncbi:MAG: DegV family protein, partial [Oscillibacter sp.]|nr:DegV family protein [Oscillibacter sp.]